METQKNYEEILISIIEYIKDHPRCDEKDCIRYINEKFNITSDEDKHFLSLAIEKVAMRHQLQRTHEYHTGYIGLFIHPDALFYLMEYRELKHSLEESKQARKQATLSTWFAVAGIIISIIGLAVSIYYSNKQIEISEKQIELERSTK
jgi:hypothetical protein